MALLCQQRFHFPPALTAAPAAVDQDEGQLVRRLCGKGDGEKQNGKDEPHRRSALRCDRRFRLVQLHRSEEHMSELQSLMRISYAVFCLKKKKKKKQRSNVQTTRKRQQSNLD